MAKSNITTYALLDLSELRFAYFSKVNNQPSNRKNLCNKPKQTNDKGA